MWIDFRILGQLTHHADLPEIRSHSQHMYKNLYLQQSHIGTCSASPFPPTHPTTRSVTVKLLSANNIAHVPSLRGFTQPCLQPHISSGATVSRCTRLGDNPCSNTPGLCGGHTARAPIVDLVFGDSDLARNQLRRAKHLLMKKPPVPERGSAAHHCAGRHTLRRWHCHDKADTATMTSS